MTTDKTRPSRSNTSQVVLDGLAVAYARYTIAWATAINDRTNWHGSWMLGLHADGLRSLESYLTYSRLFPPAFDVDEYREVTAASHLEMTQNPHAVAYRLVGRMTEPWGPSRISRTTSPCQQAQTRPCSSTVRLAIQRVTSRLCF